MKSVSDLISNVCEEQATDPSRSLFNIFQDNALHLFNIIYIIYLCLFTLLFKKMIRKSSMN